MYHLSKVALTFAQTQPAFNSLDHSKDRGLVSNSRDYTIFFWQIL